MSLGLLPLPIPSFSGIRKEGKFTMAKFCVGPKEEERGGVGYSCNEMRGPT